MSELFLGFILGSSTTAMNPVKLFIGWIMAISLMAAIVVTSWVIWTYAPLAEAFTQSLGIGPTWLINYLHIESVADGDLVAFTIQLSKRLSLCAITLFVFAVGMKFFTLVLCQLMQKNASTKKSLSKRQ